MMTTADYNLSALAEAEGSRGYAVAVDDDGEFVFRANEDGAMMELPERVLALDG